MGWSGWDMPKEHWLRKNKKAFAKRKERVTFKMRTGKDETETDRKTTVADRNEPIIIFQRSEKTKLSRLESVLRIWLLGGILIGIGLVIVNVLTESNTQSMRQRELARQHQVYLEKKQRAEKQQAAALAIESGHRFLAYEAYEDAVIEFEHALRLFPKHEEAMRGLTWSKVMICETTGRDCQAALVLLNNYLSERDDPNLSTHRMTIEKILETNR